MSDILLVLQKKITIQKNNPLYIPQSDLRKESDKHIFRLERTGIFNYKT